MPMISASAQPMGTLSQMPVAPSGVADSKYASATTAAQRCNGENDRHLRLVDGAVVAVQQKQGADANVACALYAQVMHTGCNDRTLARIDEDAHERSRKGTRSTHRMPSSPRYTSTFSISGRANSKMLLVMGPFVRLRCIVPDSPFYNAVSAGAPALPPSRLERDCSLPANFWRYSLGVQCLISRKVFVK